jgi:hypothetical protein
MVATTEPRGNGHAAVPPPLLVDEPVPVPAREEKLVPT